MASETPLPGMENRGIPELEEAAIEYATIRDERIKLNEREAALKKRVREIMHAHNKTRYEHATVEISIEPPDGEEKIKVRVKKAKPAGDDGEPPTDA